MPPRQKCAALHRDTLIVVDDLIRGVMGRLGECPNIHRPLGRVILVKAGGLGLCDLHMVKPLVVLHPV
jgi:hypothetical protein